MTMFNSLMNTEQLNNISNVNIEDLINLDPTDTGFVITSEEERI